MLEMWVYFCFKYLIFYFFCVIRLSFNDFDKMSIFYNNSINFEVCYSVRNKIIVFL